MALSITSAERAITDGHPCSKEYLERIMREYEKDETFTIKKMTSSKALNEGDNYIAEFFRVKIDAVITVDGTEKGKQVFFHNYFFEFSSSKKCIIFSN